MTVTVPTDAAGLEATLSDPSKMKEIWGDPTSAKAFLNAYTKNAMGSAITDQIREQTQAAMVDLLKGDTEGAKRLNLSPLNSGVTRGGKGEVLNKRAPGHKVDTEGGFRDAAEFMQAVYHNRSSLPNGDDLTAKAVTAQKITNSFGSTVGADGGFLIPETLRSTLLQTSLESSIVRPRATVIPMETLRVPIPMVDSTTNVGSVLGGIVAYWTEEGAALTESQAAFARVVLDAKKLTAFAIVPNELVADASAFMGFFDTAFPQALSFFEDKAFIGGTGVGEPLGWLNNPATIVQAAVGGQGANTVTFANVVAMYSRMLPSSLNSAVWIVSPAVFPQLATMSLTVGTGGAAVWMPDAHGSPVLTLFGRPVIVSEKVPTLGTTGDISFVDLSYYLIGDRQAIQASSSVDYRFGNDQTAFRVIERVDGRPWLNSALTPANSGPTLSPFVQLSSTRT